MTYFTHAALSAAVAIGLCACTTVPKIIPNTDAIIETSEPVETLKTPAVKTAISQTPTETLLYGARTKYELMTFVEVVQNANLEEILEDSGPLTVFAPNNQAFEFAQLGADADMPAILKGHIVKGAMEASRLKAAVAENGAPVKLTSLTGTELTVYVIGDNVKVSGPSGILATVTQSDMIQFNGVMHHISGVLKPKL